MSHLTWFGWLLCADWTVSALYYVAIVGKYRRSLTGVEAILVVINSALYIWGATAVGTIR